jgi:hypothetical protein
MDLLQQIEALGGSVAINSSNAQYLEDQQYDANFGDEARFAGSNVLEGFIKSFPRFASALGKSGEVISRKVIDPAEAALYATATAPIEAIRTQQNPFDAWQQQFNSEMAELQEVYASNAKLGGFIQKNINQPIADVTDNIFDWAEGDRDKIRNAEFKEGAAQFVGDILAPILPLKGADKALGGFLDAPTLAGKIKKGAGFGAGMGAVVGVGNAENPQEFLTQVGAGTLIGGFAPVGVKALDTLAKKAPQVAAGVKSNASKMVEHGKQTVNRIQQKMQQMTQDKRMAQMKKMSQSRAKDIQAKRAAKMQQEAPQQMDTQGLPKQVIEEGIAKIEQQTGKQLTPEQRNNFIKTTKQQAVMQNQMLRRRELANQRIREMKAQSEVQAVELQKQGVETQIQRIKDFLIERPKKLLPTEKQLAIRRKLLRARKVKDNIDQRFKDQGIENVDQHFRPANEEMAQYIDLEQTSFKPEFEAINSRIRDLENQKSKLRMKVKRTPDGSLESQIADALQGRRIDQASYKGYADLEPQVARNFTTKKDGVALDELAKILEDTINPDITADASEQLSLAEEVINFTKKYKSPKDYYRQKGQAEYDLKVNEIGEDLARERASLDELKKALKLAKPESVTEPRGRQAVKRFIADKEKALAKAEKIQRTKFNKQARKDLGVDDVRPDSLKLEIERLQAEADGYQKQYDELMGKIETEAQDFSEKAINSEEFYKDQGMAYAGYKDGKLKVANFEGEVANVNPARRRVVKKNGKTFEVEVDADGKTRSISRESTPAEEALLKAEEGVHRQIDRIFGLSEDPPMVTEQNVALNKTKEVIDTFSPGGKWAGKFNSWVRAAFMPIQNVVDELAPNIGLKLADLEANIVNRPYVYLNELADMVGFQYKGKFDPNDFHKYMQRMLGDKKSYLNASQTPEALSSEQIDFLTKAQPFFLKYKDLLESSGLEMVKNVEGLYAPRNVHYDKWYARQTTAKQNAIKDAVKARSDDYYDSDMILDDFAKERVVDVVTDDLVDLYYDPADSVLIQLKKLAKQQSQIEFFGEQLKQGSGHRKLIQKMVDAEGLAADDAYDVKAALERLFDKTPYSDNPIINAVNKLRFSVMLGGSATAAKQPVLGSIRYTLRFGLDNFAKGLVEANDPALNAHFASIIGDVEKASLEAKIGIWDTLSTGLFRAANRKEASMGMQSTFKWLKAHSKKVVQGKRSKSFTDYMVNRYGEERANHLIQKFGTLADDSSKSLDLETLNTVFTAARDRGSLAMTKADKAGYAIDKNMPVTNEFYKLLTYGLKDTNTLVDLTAGQLKRGNTVEGMKNIITQVGALMTLSGLATDQILRIGSGARTYAANQDFAEGYFGEDERSLGGVVFSNQAAEEIQDMYMTLLPMISRYGMDKLLDPNTQAEAIFNMVFKGLGSTGKVLTNSAIAIKEGVEKDGLKGVLDVFNPDANKSLKHLPPKVLSEIGYNIVDPAIRGDESAAVHDSVKRAKWKEQNTEEAKLSRKMDQEVEMNKRGIDPKYAGTVKGKTMLARAKDSNYQDRLKAKRQFSSEEYVRGESLRHKINSLPLEERRRAFRNLDYQDKRAYFGDMKKQAMDAYIEERITETEFNEILEFVESNAFGGLWDRVKSEIDRGAAKIGY